jgi:hypothetical protein
MIRHAWHRLEQSGHVQGSVATTANRQVVRSSRARGPPGRATYRYVDLDVLVAVFLNILRMD